ncbi:expressed unknown protein [Seminavis robusta]|uniref:Uncharacterized protein n=1 Tax=Seminavis robusta TaxID=568900 RepID=A0A9N8EXC3_9STRA|nr:expressed unknown protein [Seminavis robusta]|eukprot:Sro2146_g316400.1 n/a (264) ;mRNA; f:4209-5000
MAPFARLSFWQTSDNDSVESSDRSTSMVLSKSPMKSLARFWQPPSETSLSAPSEEFMVKSPFVPQSAPLSSSEEDSMDSSDRSSGDFVMTMEDSFLAILAFLQDHHDTVEELEELETRAEYLQFLQQAEAHVEQLCQENGASVDIPTIMALFTTAWTALQDYSMDLYKKARTKYTVFQNKQMEDFLITQQWTPKERKQLQQAQKQRRRPSALDPVAEEQILREGLAWTTRFKMDCQKGTVLTQEWARHLRALQRTATVVAVFV